jgi:hypothetical protein
VTKFYYFFNDFYEKYLQGFCQSFRKAFLENNKIREYFSQVKVSKIKAQKILKKAFRKKLT